MDVKTETRCGTFKATHVATLKIPKKYEKKLIDSGDDDFAALAKMNGESIEFMFPLGPVVGGGSENVIIFEPFVGSISRKYIRDIRRIDEAS